MFGLHFKTYSEVNLNPGMVEAVLNSHPPPADIKTQSSFNLSFEPRFIKQDEQKKIRVCCSGRSS